MSIRQPQYPALRCNHPRRVDVASLLRDHHAQCEVNYLHLERLLPDFLLDATVVIGCAVGESASRRLRIRVLERSRYTALVGILEDRPVWGHRALELRARTYLDVAMADVVASPPSVTRLLPRYEYPNPRMLARDEKWQLNRLLGEWLSNCFASGYLVEHNVFDASR